MSYSQFAYLYDDLMKDVPYHLWVKVVNEAIQKYGIKGKQLLDLACGTGELTLRLSENGFDVTGVDLSEDMLAVAQAKLEEKGHNPKFFQQNMAELELMTEFDVVGIFCDSINYLETEEDVISTFQHVHSHVKEKGLFIFDVHSVHKMVHIFKDQTFAYNGEDISYIWQCFEGENPFSIEHELTFFACDPSTSQYDRYDELHFQRTYPVPQYIEWLKQSGFQVLDVLVDFEHKTLEDECERIIFVTAKQ